MAIVKVQNQSAAQSSNATSVAVTLSVTVAGNFLFCCITGNNSTTPTLSGFTQIDGTVDPGTGFFAYYFYRENIPAGLTTITATTANALWSMSCAEFSGVATSSSLDKNSAAPGTSGTSTSPASATVTPTQNNELVIGIAVHSNTSVATAAGSFSIIDAAGEGGSIVPCDTEYFQQGTAAAIGSSFSLTVSVTWATAVATFFAAAAATALDDGAMTFAVVSSGNSVVSRW